MPRVRAAAKVAGLGVGAAAAVSGLVYGAQRLVVARTRRRPDPDAGRHIVAPADEVLVLDSHDGGTISVLRRGSGPPIVLCHGVTLSTSAWVKQLEHLPEQGFTVYAMDSRGHGASKSGTTGHSVENLAHDLRTVLEDLDLHDAVLVGHSMGGIAVQALAAYHPEVVDVRARGLVLVSTLARTMFSDARRLHRLVERHGDALPDFGSLMSHPNLGFFLARLGFGSNPQPTHVEMTRRMIEACDAETTRLATRALLGLDLVPDIARIDLPTLVVCGSADLVTPPAESRRIARTIPGARLVVLEGAGHMLMLERTDELDRLLVEFAREVGRGRRDELQVSVAGDAR